MVPWQEKTGCGQERKAMIVGIGIDIVEIGRIEAMMKRRESAASRFLTEKEQRLLARRQGAARYEFAAGRFAAKEAASKALGTGIGKTVGFLDLEILPAESGKPELRVSPDVLRKLDLDPARVRVHLSISHSRTHAIAQVVLETM